MMMVVIRVINTASYNFFAEEVQLSVCELYKHASLQERPELSSFPPIPSEEKLQTKSPSSTSKVGTLFDSR